MATPTADKARTYFPSKEKGADGQALDVRLVDTPLSVSTIKCAELSATDDYYNGALGWFITGALVGEFIHVLDYDGTSKVLTLAKELSAAPAEDDQFILAVGGNYRSTYETFGLTADGDLPELESVVGDNIGATAMTIKKISAAISAGTLSVFYDFSLDLLFVKMDAGAYGVGLDVSGDVSDGIVFLPDGEAYIQVDITAVNLPGGDATDTYIIAIPERTNIPDQEGAQTGTTNGLTRYHGRVVKNTDGADTMVGLLAYNDKPAGSNTTLAGGESLGTTAGDFEATDASDWPTRGFWLKNTTVNAGAGDCRYAKYRSGNQIYCQAVEWATLDFDGGDNEIERGDAIEDGTSGATAVVDQIVVTSGTWGGNDAAGSMILKLVVGTFGAGNDIEVASLVSAQCDGASNLSLRGYDATNWSAADDIEIMTDLDIGIDEPSTDQFEDPEPYQAPDNVVFDDKPDSGDSISIGDLTSSSIYMIWLREWIPADAEPRANIDADTHLQWS